MGLISGRDAGLAAGLGCGREAGRSILEPVIGLRFTGLPLLLRLGADVLAPPPLRSARSPRASAVGAIKAHPTRRDKMAGISFMA
jgi:hypothetical protein